MLTAWHYHKKNPSLSTSFSSFPKTLQPIRRPAPMKVHQKPWKFKTNSRSEVFPFQCHLRAQAQTVIKTLSNIIRAYILTLIPVVTAPEIRVLFFLLYSSILSLTHQSLWTGCVPGYFSKSLWDGCQREWSTVTVWDLEFLNGSNLKQFKVSETHFRLTRAQKNTQLQAKQVLHSKKQSPINQPCISRIEVWQVLHSEDQNTFKFNQWSETSILLLCTPRIQSLESVILHKKIKTKTVPYMLHFSRISLAILHFRRIKV